MARSTRTRRGYPPRATDSATTPKEFFAAPSFKEAAVTLGGHDKAIAITLKYPRK